MERYAFEFALSQSIGGSAKANRHGVRQRVRLMQVYHRGQWYSYLANELNPARLPVAYAVALHGRRWRIEAAFHVVKRRLGPAYFGTGAQDGVELRV